MPPYSFAKHKKISSNLTYHLQVPNFLHIQSNLKCYKLYFMKISKIISAASLILLASNSYAWTLVYAHDANGNPTAGSLQTLRNAASNGSSIKVVSSPPGAHDWQVPCTAVSVRHDRDAQDVLCTGSLSLWMLDASGPQFGLSYTPPQSVSYIMNTKGQYTHISVRLSNNEILNTYQWRFPMRWYAD